MTEPDTERPSEPASAPTLPDSPAKKRSPTTAERKAARERGALERAARDERRAEVARRRLAGVPMRQIAADLKIHPETVSSDERAYYQEQARTHDWQADRRAIASRLLQLYDAAMAEAANFRAADCSIPDDEVAKDPHRAAFRQEARRERTYVRFQAYELGRKLLMDQARVSGYLAEVTAPRLSSGDGDNGNGAHGPKELGAVRDQSRAIEAVIRTLTPAEQDELAEHVDAANALVSRARAIERGTARPVRVGTTADVVSSEVAEDD